MNLYQWGLFLLVSLLVASFSAESVLRESQELFLKGERLAAYELLSKAWEDQKDDAVLAQEILDVWHRIALRFYSEEALVKYSLASSDFQARHNLYAQALALEPENVRIILSLAGSYLLQGNCQRASKLQEKGMQYSPHLSELWILSLQIWMCKGEYFKVLESINSQKEINIKSPVKFIYALAKLYSTEKDSQNLLNGKDFVKNELLELTEQEKKEIVYQFVEFERMRLLNKKERAVSKGRFFLDRCQNLRPRERALFSWDPLICSQAQINSIEAFIDSSGILP